MNPQNIPLSLEDFSVADIGSLRAMGFTYSELAGPDGLYSEQVSNGSVQPETYNPVVIL